MTNSSIFDRTQWVREVHLIGIGGIGSWVAYWLMKQGVPVLHVYDSKRVSGHNPYYQLWNVSHVDMFKVDALVKIAERDALETDIVPHRGRFMQSSELNFDSGSVVISGVDSMTARIEEIWPALKYNKNVELYMDARIGGKDLALYTLHPCDPSQIKSYEAWLYTSKQASQDPCANRDDMAAALNVGSWIVNNLISFARDERTAAILHGKMSVVAPIGGATPVVQIP